MQQNWRLALKENIEVHYIQNMQEEWYDFSLTMSGLLNITIVSNRFVHLSLSQREEPIRELLHESNAPTETGFLSLYTLREAATIGLSKPPAKKESRVDNWYDLAYEAMNAPESPNVQQHRPCMPHTVAFYSFKGGVGRTTALFHVAWLLAQRGRKVVAVDLDLEAPGLSTLANLTPIPKYGIMDYFDERSYSPRGVEPSILIGDIFTEVRIPDARGRLFMVPAGSLSLNYMAKMDDLRALAVTEQGEDLWSFFLREITEKLHPDILLLDSRTGISEWGAFSLLRAADQAIVFLSPNEQNRRGVDLLLEALRATIPLQLVFSPVPSGYAGIEQVKECWQAMQRYLKENQEVETELDMAEPINVPYLPELALARSYPVLPLLSIYLDIANVIGEGTFI
jgi:MinD-like ATPase involved in chromosome partitioning or flagellar assembly